MADDKAKASKDVADEKMRADEVAGEGDDKALPPSASNAEKVPVAIKAGTDQVDLTVAPMTESMQRSLLPAGQDSRSFAGVWCSLGCDSRSESAGICVALSCVWAHTTQSFRQRICTAGICCCGDSSIACLSPAADFTTREYSYGASGGWNLGSESSCLYNLLGRLGLRSEFYGIEHWPFGQLAPNHNGCAECLPSSCCICSDGCNCSLKLIPTPCIPATAVLPRER